MLPLQTWFIWTVFLVLSVGVLYGMSRLIDRLRNRRRWNGPGLTAADMNPEWELQAPQYTDHPTLPAPGSLSVRPTLREK